jgi:hypothetical protein
MNILAVCGSIKQEGDALERKLRHVRLSYMTTRDRHDYHVLLWRRQEAAKSTSCDEGCASLPLASPEVSLLECVSTFGVVIIAKILMNHVIVKFCAVCQTA